MRGGEGLDEGAGPGNGVQIIAQPKGLPGSPRPAPASRGRIIATRSEVCGVGRAMCLFFSDSLCDVLRLRQIGVHIQALLLPKEPWAGAFISIGLSVPLYERGTAAPPCGEDEI